MIHERRDCRACASTRLEPILDLGSTALANDFLDAGEVAGYRSVLPLRLRLCKDCSLVQLADVVDPGVLYSRYAYVTSTSRTMDEHLGAQAGRVLAAAGVSGGPKVLEIASNTGVYLRKFKALGCEVLGVEPARNIAELAEQLEAPGADGDSRQQVTRDRAQAQAVRQHDGDDRGGEIHAGLDEEGVGVFHA